MFIGDFILAFLIALLLSLLLGFGFGWERPGSAGVWPSIWFLFIILFLAVLAVGGMVQPFGPHVWGVYWLPFLLVGIIVALIIAAAVPPRRIPRSRTEAVKQREQMAEARVALGAFFWVLLVLLILATLVTYLA